MAVLGIRQSVSDSVWEKKNVDERLVLALEQKYQLSALLAEVLVARGITLENIDSFLNPTLKNNLPNPFSLKDMEKAAYRMAESVISNEPIGLMGDYDVDGATSVAVLKMYLKECGISVLTFIPDREDGYGPNSKKMLEFQQKGCSVVATLDCGITAFDPIEYGQSLGLDIVVLDHHSPEVDLPKAYALVNPKRLDEPTDHPCRHMAAVGVVFLFVVALNKVLREKGFFNEKVKEPDLLKFLDLVALGTVCDVVPLQGINRLFVKSGLQHMRTMDNLGLKALAKKSGLDEQPTTYHLGFVFGPRINACGRIGKSDIAMELLSCLDETETLSLADELEKLNTIRREIEADVLLQAIEQVESQPLSVPFILVKGYDWHQGVVGIVAGRLKDKYNLPVFALSVEGDEVKGSSRSVDGIDLGNLIMNALSKGILTRGGGHMKAAGFSLKIEKIDEFYQYLKENISSDGIIKNNVLMIDSVIDIMGATSDFVEALSVLAPFGESNPEPRIVIKDVMITGVNSLKNGHVSCSFVGRTGGRLSAIAFRVADTEIGRYLLTHQGSYIHVAGHLKQDTWKGNTKLQFYIEDIAPTD